MYQLYIILPPITISVMVKCLQKDYNECHERFDETELQRGLFTEAQEANGVRLTGETARTVQTVGPDRLAANLTHDITLTAQVLVAQ